MRKCSLESLNSVFAEIAKAATLYIPADRTDGSAVYTKWEEGVVYSNALNTVRSPKDFFFPQMENLMEFKTQGKTIEIIDTRSETEDFVVFGVRACDVKSFEILDRVFLSEPVDSYYAARRAHGVIVSMACTRPSETCFCQTFGINPAEPAGDISVWKTETEVFFKSNTEKGAALMQKLEALTEECTEEAVDAQKEKISAVMKKLPLANLTTEGFGGGKTKELFDNPAWEELSQTCLGCGTCTFV